MVTIEEQDIKAAIDQVNALDEASLEKYMETIALSQEELVGYLLSSALEFENDMLADLTVYYLSLMVKAFELKGATISKLSDKDVEAFQDEFIPCLDEINEQEDFTALRNLLAQQTLIDFMSLEINGEDADGETLDDETAMQLFIVSSAMIGLLNKSVNG